MPDRDSSPFDTPLPERGTLLRSSLRPLPRQEFLLAILGLLLAAFLRTVHIAFREYFGGEFYTIEYIRGIGPGFPESFFRGSMPLYYEFIRWWGHTFGVNNEMVLRLPSVVFGLVAVAGFMVYAQRFLKGTAFAVAVMAIALNPVLVATSNEATPYALLCLVVVMSNYACVRALNEGTRKHWVSYAIFTAVGCLTHPIFLFLLFAQFVFAVSRPKKTPRQFVLVSVAGIFILTALAIVSAIYAHEMFPKKVDPDMPVVDDAVRALVGVVMGDFDRYWSTEFVRAMLYLFLLVALGLSFYYYRMRNEEAKALPENVMFIDETQDVVGRWKRLSLASFLSFQWATFAIPLICITIMGSFASRIDLPPEFFIICLPSLLFLVAAGIDAAPGYAGKIGLGILFLVAMTFYNVQSLSDRAFGASALFQRVQKSGFDPDKDALLFIHLSDMEQSARFYSRGIRGVPIPRQDTMRRIRQAVQDRERVFAVFHNDLQRVGNGDISIGRYWFDRNSSDFAEANEWVLSENEGVVLRLYERKAKPPGEPAQPPPPDTLPEAMPVEAESAEPGTPDAG